MSSTIQNGNNTSLPPIGSNNPTNGTSSLSITFNRYDSTEIRRQDSDRYDSKQFRRESSSSSLYEQAIIRARSPREILLSLYRDFSWELFRDGVLSLVCFVAGYYGPKKVVLPLMGGVNQRPIPYQITKAGDVLLDLTLANDLVPKSDVTFPCE